MACWTEPAARTEPCPAGLRWAGLIRAGESWVEGKSAEPRLPGDRLAVPTQTVRNSAVRVTVFHRTAVQLSVANSRTVEGLAGGNSVG
jgi:hypothetical protein